MDYFFAGAADSAGGGVEDGTPGCGMGYPKGSYPPREYGLYGEWADMGCDPGTGYTENDSPSPPARACATETPPACPPT